MAAPSGSGSSNPSPAAPKILLAKPGSVPAGSTVAKFIRGGTGGDDESLALRSRLPPPGSLNLLSDSWEFHIDRILPFMTENTDFTVIGVIGPPGVGKSTILNELYGFDGTSPGMLPPFVTESEEIRAMARHCTTGIELRISAERLILLDTQPIFSPSVLAEMTRPDGSSTISVVSGEVLSADLAHEIMSIQLGVFLTSICHVLLVISEGVHDINMWHLMLTVDLLKHGIPDPSSLASSYSQGSNLGPEKENKETWQEAGEEYLAFPVFVHTKVQDQHLSPPNIVRLRKALSRYFNQSSFMGTKYGYQNNKQAHSFGCPDMIDDSGSTGMDLILIPSKFQDEHQRSQYESYTSMLGKLRDQVLSMKCQPFAKNVSEREWLRNSSKIWEIVKNSQVIAEYTRTLQNSGMFRR
ncbi:PREDICTED: protein SMG9-like isoform X1 [Nelumbo nucifera]|uniref:Protein SMG9-like isoform X1 n=1 Tax=Nelumbo nucifera TaxID=4432 RepID=A0A1U8A932_NELNU|nr:PREDICTED: protein SMG9-like isoform X1 [Nelumbo nucifera]